MELIVSEKYNAAERIAGILSNDSASRETVSGVTVFKWGGTYCMGLAGHVVEVDFPDDYNDWGASRRPHSIDAEITKRASKPDRRRAEHVSERGRPGRHRDGLRPGGRS